MTDSSMVRLADGDATRLLPNASAWQRTDVGAAPPSMAPRPAVAAVRAPQDESPLEAIDITLEPMFWDRLAPAAAPDRTPGDGPLDDAAGDHAGTLPGRPAQRPAGPRFAGRYEILGQIGRGGMATVYRAHDPSLGRDVAIKFLHAQLCADPEYRARFLREARAAGGLAHSHIVTVHDVGEIDGRPYMAMELLEGQSLSDAMQEGQVLPIRDVIVMGIQLARALDYAHAHGVVHRDIKPGNIMLSRASRTIKVTDFGIAHIETAGNTQRTRAGDIIGTPQYMSPEQAMGERLDGRSDLFSLGIVLYQMITGQRPFQGEGLVALVMKITHEDPMPMDKLRPDVPPALRRVVERTLAKPREQRFQTGNELAEALLKVLTAHDVEQRRRTQPRIVPLRVKWAAMMASIVAAVMVLCAAVITHKQYDAMMAQVGDYGSSLSRFIAEQNAAAVLGEDWVAVEVSLLAIMKTRDFHSVTVVDNQGIVRASSNQALTGQPYQAPPSETVDVRAGQVKVTRYRAQGEKVLGFEAPITFQNKGLGRVALGVPEQPLTQVARLSVALMVVLVLVTVAAVAVAMYVAGNWFAKPIELVRDSMAEIAKGRFGHRIREKRNDEFGQLYQAFDEMADALDHRQGQATDTGVPEAVAKNPGTSSGSP